MGPCDRLGVLGEQPGRPQLVAQIVPGRLQLVGQPAVEHERARGEGVGEVAGHASEATSSPVPGRLVPRASYRQVSTVR